MDNGSGLIIAGQRERVPGLSIENWLDNPVLRLRGEDVRPRRTTWIRQVVLHTTKGIPGGNDQRPQKILSGFGPSVNAGERCSRWWSKSPEAAGAHVVVDHDGRIFCCADLQTEAAQHAGHANQSSIGIEIYQGKDAELYEEQLQVTVRLCDFLTRRFGIQRQIPHQYVKATARMLSPDEIDRVVGVIGHRDISRSRGLGDPGNAVFNRLGLADYEPMNYEVREDLDTWRHRQRDLGMAKPDGVPGPKTVGALKTLGKPWGMWVQRPGDTGPELVA